MRTCCRCGVSFTPTTKSYRCLECRKEYDRAWRERRRAEGKPSSGARMPREYHRQYEQEYYQNPENRSRRNALMRGYSRAPDTREHHKARWQVSRAVAAGKLVRQPCEVCGVTTTEAHHDDYGKPLEVRWLCMKHHRELHRKAEGSLT